MMKTTVASVSQKYVNAVFLAGGLLVGFVAHRVLKFAFGYFQVGRRFGVDTWLLENLIPIAIGIVTFIFFQRNSKAYTFVSDATSELVRVVWPSKIDVQRGTIVVIVTVLLMGAFFALVDYLFIHLIRFVLGT